MIKEEKINLLKAIIQECEDYQWWRKATLSEIIEDLEQEPNKNCISRQSLLDEATTIETDDYSGNEIIEVVEVDDIKDLPPVTPTRKKGHWIPTSYWYSNYCSNCSCKTDNQSNFCPNCGAKMTESDEEIEDNTSELQDNSDTIYENICQSCIHKEVCKYNTACRVDANDTCSAYEPANK